MSICLLRSKPAATRCWAAGKSQTVEWAAGPVADHRVTRTFQKEQKKGGGVLYFIYNVQGAYVIPSHCNIKSCERALGAFPHG